MIKLLTSAVCAFAAVATTPLMLAPPAHADYTWTVFDICNANSAGTVPMPIFASPEITCGDPEYWANSGTVPGLYISAGRNIPRIMAELRPGSYSTDPANRWADWVVPEGSQPKPKPKDEFVACDRINGRIVCGPEIPIPCNGPGSPCGSR